MGLNTGESNLRFSPDSPWNVIYDMDVLFPKSNDIPEVAPVNEQLNINLYNR